MVIYSDLKAKTGAAAFLNIATISATKEIRIETIIPLWADGTR